MGAGVSYVATSPSIPGYPYATTVKFNVLGSLAENTSYYLLVDANVFLDLDNFGNLAVTDDTELAYSTDDVLFPGLQGSFNSNFSTTINSVRPRTFTSTTSSSSNLSISAMRVKVVSSSQTATTVLSSTGHYVTALVNVPNTTYVANNMNNIFATSQARISSDNTISTYKIEFTCSNGKFGTTSGSVLNYSISGSLTDVNNSLTQTRFFPTKNYTGSISYSMLFYIDNVLSSTTTRTLTYSSTNSVGNTYSYTASTYTVWVPTVVEREYAIMDYLIIGAGGGGAGNNTESLSNGGGGGGAGEVYYYTNQTISLSSYDVEVGAGGQIKQNINGFGPIDGGAGGNSVFSGHTISGGNGGIGIHGSVEYGTGTLSNVGGASGSGYHGGNAIISGSAGASISLLACGGGGGSSSVGSNGYIESSTYYRGGDGGSGTPNSITGTSILYAIGGGGSSTQQNNSSLNVGQGGTTPGSGGFAGRKSYPDGLYTNVPTVGKDGCVIIKTHI